MIDISRAITAIALTVACAGCATVTRGTTEQLQILSEPAGADARTSMGYVCVTPCTLQVNRKDEFFVTISKPGYESVQIPVVTKINGGGGAALAGNILAGGLIGIGVDASTGSGYDHEPNPVSVELVPVRRAPPPPAERPSRRAPKAAPAATSVPEG